MEIAETRWVLVEKMVCVVKANRVSQVRWEDKTLLRLQVRKRLVQELDFDGSVGSGLHRCKSLGKI